MGVIGNNPLGGGSGNVMLGGSLQKPKPIARQQAPDSFAVTSQGLAMDMSSKKTSRSKPQQSPGNVNEQSMFGSNTNVDTSFGVGSSDRFSISSSSSSSGSGGGSSSSSSSGSRGSSSKRSGQNNNRQASGNANTVGQSRGANSQLSEIELLLQGTGLDASALMVMLLAVIASFTHLKPGIDFSYCC